MFDELRAKLLEGQAAARACADVLRHDAVDVLNARLMDVIDHFHQRLAAIEAKLNPGG